MSDHPNMRYDHDWRSGEYGAMSRLELLPVRGSQAIIPDMPNSSSAAHSMLSFPGSSAIDDEEWPNPSHNYSWGSNINSTYSIPDTPNPENSATGPPSSDVGIASDEALQPAYMAWRWTGLEAESQNEQLQGLPFDTYQDVRSEHEISQSEEASYPATFLSSHVTESTEIREVEGEMELLLSLSSLAEIDSSKDGSPTPLSSSSGWWTHSVDVEDQIGQRPSPPFDAYQDVWSGPEIPQAHEISSAPTIPPQYVTDSTEINEDEGVMEMHASLPSHPPLPVIGSLHDCNLPLSSSSSEYAALHVPNHSASVIYQSSEPEPSDPTPLANEGLQLHSSAASHSYNIPQTPLSHPVQPSQWHWGHQAGDDPLLIGEEKNNDLVFNEVQAPGHYYSSEDILVEHQQEHAQNHGQRSSDLTTNESRPHQADLGKALGEEESRQVPPYTPAYQEAPYKSYSGLEYALTYRPGEEPKSTSSTDVQTSASLTGEDPASEKIGGHDGNREKEKKKRTRKPASTTTATRSSERIRKQMEMRSSGPQNSAPTSRPAQPKRKRGPKTQHQTGKTVASGSSYQTSPVKAPAATATSLSATPSLQDPATSKPVGRYTVFEQDPLSVLVIENSRSQPDVPRLKRERSKEMVDHHVEGIFHQAVYERPKPKEHWIELKFGDAR